MAKCRRYGCSRQGQGYNYPSCTDTKCPTKLQHSAKPRSPEQTNTAGHYPLDQHSVGLSGSDLFPSGANE